MNFAYHRIVIDEKSSFCRSEDPIRGDYPIEISSPMGFPRPLHQEPVPHHQNDAELPMRNGSEEFHRVVEPDDVPIPRHDQGGQVSAPSFPLLFLQVLGLGPLQPPGSPPVPLSHHGHHRWHKIHPDHGRVKQYGKCQGEPELLKHD